MRKLTDSELMAAFSEIREDTPIWRAITQLLDDTLENATAQVASPLIASDHGAIAHCAGGVNWAFAFRADLKDRFKQTHLLA